MKNEKREMRVDTQKAYEAICLRLENGFWGDGVLSSSRTLAAEFGIGRGAIAAILERMKSEGLVKITGDRRILSTVNFKPSHLVLLWGGADSNDANPESQALISGILHEAESCGVNVTMKRNESSELCKTPISESCLGIVFIDVEGSKETMRYLQERAIPAVVANHEIGTEFACTLVNFREVGRIAARELLSFGHHRMGVISHPEWFMFKEMLSGFRGALAEEDIFFDMNDLVKDRYYYKYPEEESEVLCNLRRLLSRKDRPTAFFVMRDKRAAKFYQVCRELNIRIPEDVSIIGYDNLSWSNAELMGLSTIAEPAMELGGAAVKMLKQWKHTGLCPDNIVVDTPLIRRTSIAPPPQTDSSR